MCNGICTKMYNFFQSCTNYFIPISIFLKSCRMVKNAVQLKKKLYGFGTLWFCLKFICNGISTKMYNFFKSYTNSVVTTPIFLKSCTTKEKSCTALIHCSLALKFICNGTCTKMYNFFQSCTNSVMTISIFLKCCTMIKKLYSQRKKLYNL